MLSGMEEDLFIVITLKKNLPMCGKMNTYFPKDTSNGWPALEGGKTKHKCKHNNQLTKSVADENLHPTKIPLERRIDLEQLCKIQRANMK